MECIIPCFFTGVQALSPSHLRQTLGRTWHVSARIHTHLAHTLVAGWERDKQTGTIMLGHERSPQTSSANRFSTLQWFSPLTQTRRAVDIFVLFQWAHLQVIYAPVPLSPFITSTVKVTQHCVASEKIKKINEKLVSFPSSLSFFTCSGELRMHTDHLQHTRAFQFQNV